MEQTQQSQQNHKKYLEVSQEDKAKILAARNEAEKSKETDESARFLSKFGKHFGWQAVVDIMEEKYEWLTWEFAYKMLDGAEREEAQIALSRAYGAFVGSISAQTEKPAKTYKQLTKDLVKASK